MRLPERTIKKANRIPGYLSVVPALENEPVLLLDAGGATVDVTMLVAVALAVAIAVVFAAEERLAPWDARLDDAAARLECETVGNIGAPVSGFDIGSEMPDGAAAVPDGDIVGNTGGPVSGFEITRDILGVAAPTPDCELVGEFGVPITDIEFDNGAGPTGSNPAEMLAGGVATVPGAPTEPGTTKVPTDCTGAVAVSPGCVGLAIVTGTAGCEAAKVVT